MPEPRHWYIVLYDVRDPRRLSQVRKIMISWGSTLQYSVFKVRGTPRELERLRYELARVLESEDALMVVRLCPGCAARVQVSGAGAAAFDDSLPDCQII